MTKPAACIFGCEGPRLSAAEKRFFKSSDPWGFILFARNISDAAQVRALTSEIRDTVGRNVPVLIDQEGGRVQRLRAPEWSEWLPPMEHALRNPDSGSVALRYRIIAAELHALGIDVNCAPMLDIATPDSHEIIENRCFGRDAETVAEMGRAAANGLLAGGVLPIIKHIPGHGRANMDSHFDLPVLDTPLTTLKSSDFIPFTQLSDLPMAMTAHIIYTDIDPDNCATQSTAVINSIRNDIGFDGLIMTDDLSMKALKGSFADRTNASFSAGCDVVLHCNGVMDEMLQIADATPKLSGKALTRADAALNMRKTPEPFDINAAKSAFSQMMGRAA
ncbi:MAG: beta-N-acetylhexosaminidase [Proteobacteria bacterium]|nr:beta-N-acetylhexosaminidase [Pseudomonadota bacterium]